MIKQKSHTYLLWWGIFILIVGVALPLGARQYQLALLTEIIIFALFAVSYNLLLGYAGLLSFGHAMFFGMGAYMVAVALNRIPGLPFFGAVIVSVMVTTATSLAVGSLLFMQSPQNGILLPAVTMA